METLQKLTLAVFVAILLFGAVGAATNPVQTAHAIQAVFRAPIDHYLFGSPRVMLALIP